MLLSEHVLYSYTPYVFPHFVSIGQHCLLSWHFHNHTCGAHSFSYRGYSKHKNFTGLSAHCTSHDICVCAAINTHGNIWNHNHFLQSTSCVLQIKGFMTTLALYLSVPSLHWYTCKLHHCFSRCFATKNFTQSANIDILRLLIIIVPYSCSPR